MTPGPSLHELITTVHAETATDNPLDQLAAASATVAALEEVGDALLGHFVDQCRRRGHSWSEISGSLGVTKQAAHKRFSIASSPTADRMTERARTAMRAAVDAARLLGHRYVGTEHVLLGLYEPARGVAAQILVDAGITRARVEEQVLAVAPRHAALGPDEAVPFTPRAAASIEHAISEALTLGHNYVGTEHLLLALFADTDAVAATILLDAGATYDQVRARVIEMLSGYTTPKH